MTRLTKTASSAALLAAVGAGILGLGAGTASATPAAGPGVPWAQDHGWGHGDWDDWHHDNGRHRGWYDRGPEPGVYINLPCVTGPLGYVTWCP